MKGPVVPDMPKCLTVPAMREACNPFGLPESLPTPANMHMQSCIDVQHDDTISVMRNTHVYAVIMLQYAVHMHDQLHRYMAPYCCSVNLKGFSSEVGWMSTLSPCQPASFDDFYQLSLTIAFSFSTIANTRSMPSFGVYSSVAY